MLRRYMLLLGITAALAILAAMRPIRQADSLKHRDFVPDSETAIRVAEAVLDPIYGRKQIESERPFSARLSDGRWIVEGSLPAGWMGGVARIVISKADCRIISVMHGKYVTP